MPQGRPMAAKKKKKKRNTCYGGWSKLSDSYQQSELKNIFWIQKNLWLVELCSAGHSLAWFTLLALPQTRYLLFHPISEMGPKSLLKCSVIHTRNSWKTHLHSWLIHVNVWQKPPQYCKIISLQLKGKKKKKRRLNGAFFMCSISVLRNRIIAKTAVDSVGNFPN